LIFVLLATLPHDCSWNKIVKKWKKGLITRLGFIKQLAPAERWFLEDFLLTVYLKYIVVVDLITLHPMLGHGQC